MENGAMWTGDFYWLHFIVLCATFGRDAMGMGQVESVSDTRVNLRSNAVVDK